MGRLVNIAPGPAPLSIVNNPKLASMLIPVRNTRHHVNLLSLNSQPSGFYPVSRAGPTTPLLYRAISFNFSSTVELRAYTVIIGGRERLCTFRRTQPRLRWSRQHRFTTLEIKSSSSRQLRDKCGKWLPSTASRQPRASSFPRSCQETNDKYVDFLMSFI